jgi:hypothetical protein
MVESRYQHAAYAPTRKVVVKWSPEMGCWGLYDPSGSWPFAAVMPDDIEPGGRYHSVREFFLRARSSAGHPQACINEKFILEISTHTTR